MDTNDGPGWVSPSDWTAFRPIITQHYRDDNMKLKELIVFMDTTYGFKATAKMYKDRLKRWKISKNIRASDITSVVVRNDTSQPEFYTVGDRMIRADRLQQAMQRRATVARRRAQQIPPSPPTPTGFIIPETILHQIRDYITATFATQATALVNIALTGPIQRCRLAFEETFGNLHLVTGIDRDIAFRSLHGTFDLLRPSLQANDPHFLVVLLQMLAMCHYFRTPDIRRMVLAYLADLTVLMLGPRHPLAVICGGFRSLQEEADLQSLYRLASEAAWHQFRGYLYPFRMDAFVHLTASHADTLDSLKLRDEAEQFLRFVVANNARDKDIVPVDRRLFLELHLVHSLRRQGKYDDALSMLEGIKSEILEHEPMMMRESEDKTVELTYETLRINGFCECEGGELEKGRECFREALALMEEKKGRYSPRTTRALRDVIRVGAGDDSTIKDLEDRLAMFSVETENFL